MPVALVIMYPLRIASFSVVTMLLAFVQKPRLDHMVIQVLGDSIRSVAMTATTASTIQSIEPQPNHNAPRSVSVTVLAATTSSYSR